MGARTLGSDTTVYVQSGQQTIADYTAGAAPASSTYRYVYASYIDEPVMRFQTSGSIRIYYHRNQQYSITALTNSSGAVLERYAYTAYGVPTICNASGTVLTSSAHNNRYTYTGREWDNDIKQYHYRARMYDASLGRFCSRDPIGFNIPVFSRYEYASANPIARFDPTGHVDVCVGLEIDLVPIIGIEFGCGIVYDTDHPSQSGIYCTNGLAVGVDIGAGVGVHVHSGDVEGLAVGLDINAGVHSVQGGVDIPGDPYGGYSYGAPGLGASASTTGTWTLSPSGIIGPTYPRPTTSVPPLPPYEPVNPVEAREFFCTKFCTTETVIEGGTEDDFNACMKGCRRAHPISR